MVDNQTMEESSPDEYDEVVITKNMDTVDAFSSCDIPVKVEKAYTGEHINVMTQALQTKHGSLPQCLTVQNAYTELRKGSTNAVVVVRNSRAYPHSLKKKTSVARVMATTVVLELPVETKLLEEEMSPRALTHIN